MTKGSGDFERSLKKFQRDIEKKVERASQPATAGELFNENFMRQYTDFDSFEALVEAGGWGPATRETFEVIPDTEWEAWVQKHTQFSSWIEMQQKAGNELIQRRLG